MRIFFIFSLLAAFFVSSVAYSQPMQPGQSATPGQFQPPASTMQPQSQPMPTMPSQPNMMPQMMAQMHSAAGNYSDTVIGGWKIKINSKLTSDHHLMTEKALASLSSELAAIEKKLPTESLPYLKEMNIWLEFSTPDNIPVQYHRSAQWLAQNGYDTRKESSIEVVAIDYQNLDRESLPLLGPFAGAYQDRVLGANNRQITAAFEHAKSAKIYGDSTAKNAYILQDKHQYFVAISTAYFGESDTPPYNRSKLKSMDHEGYELVEKMWKAK